ncbi:hypothetical protein BAUCODRAFT_400359 [Baudoinia panamericana UAMH 10762]|uniref:Uncharacterized protein n=1 Tax=Baudoinia panamericana (strain UAMH 10762) TaxID=717646 RepID=M2MR96_BAUPA|nr:uncharacterized protein BAUCODRAFT_400359 [Baudoinia panamericana UAMH 10762]EMC99361.1 hypothetical protein BAUCODRAFT_400359 [Baudoinia panamericana UAMH 10762]
MRCEMHVACETGTDIPAAALCITIGLSARATRISLSWKMLSSALLPRLRSSGIISSTKAASLLWFRRSYSSSWAGWLEGKHWSLLASLYAMISSRDRIALSTNSSMNACRNLVCSWYTGNVCQHRLDGSCSVSTDRLLRRRSTYPELERAFHLSIALRAHGLLLPAL